MRSLGSGLRRASNMPRSRRSDSRTFCSSMPAAPTGDSIPAPSHGPAPTACVGRRNANAPEGVSSFRHPGTGWVRNQTFNLGLSLDDVRVAGGRH